MFKPIPLRVHWVVLEQALLTSKLGCQRSLSSDFLWTRRKNNLPPFNNIQRPKSESIKLHDDNQGSYRSK